MWIDDPSFNLEYHIRHTALPSPGSEEQLRSLAARIHSQQLDRAKPLWETWLVQGLEGDRFALISKTHHALVDGIAGVDLATVLFDAEPNPPALPHEGEPWRPQPEPSSLDLAARGIRGLVRTPFELAGRAASAATRPTETFETTREAIEGVGEIAWATLNPAPATPLNVEIGPHRRVVFLREELDDFQLVKNAFGGTVNDVVLTVVSGGLQKWLRSRGTRTEGLELRALVPMSIRSDADRGAMGNRLAAMRGPLPVYVEDPVARLRVVRAAMDGLKESKQAVGAEVLAGVQNFTPPTVLAQASRLNFSTRLFNLLVTNVPGPQFPLYVLGRAAPGPLPGRVPAAQPRARGGDHVLQRLDGLRPARRLRRDARPRGLRHDGRRLAHGADRRRQEAPALERQRGRDEEEAGGGGEAEAGREGEAENELKDRAGR